MWSFFLIGHPYVSGLSLGLYLGMEFNKNLVFGTPCYHFEIGSCAHSILQSFVGLIVTQLGSPWIIWPLIATWCIPLNLELSYHLWCRGQLPRHHQHISWSTTCTQTPKTSFRSITMLCGTDDTMHNIPLSHYSDWMWRKIHKILSVPHNTVMDMNNVMPVP